MMNFSAFGGFSGIHQFAAKFDAQTFQTNNHDNGSRYHTNTNHFNQNTTSVPNSNIMQYGQNISIPYTQTTQTDHNSFLNTTDQKNKNQLIKMDRDREEVINQQILQNVNQSWQTLANPANTVDYSSHLLSASLPITIQHFLKYSETIKKENSIGNERSISGSVTPGNLNLGGMDTSGFNIKSDILNLKNGGIGNNGLGSNLNLSLGNGFINNGAVGNLINNGISTNNTTLNVPTTGLNNHNINMPNNDNNTVVVEDPVAPSTTTTKGKKKKRKAVVKKIVVKKPRPKPGEIRETKALDGSTLFCCPECQMAYPDRSLIEQHVISHAVERRFVCDICNAALKRKDHLTRHKLSHIPDRPHICNICLKSFKRKEQLTLHIVIHSGEKKHICVECGKGFYRKDHLRKHTRSHIARRVKSEVSAQNATNNQGNSNTIPS